MTIDQKTLDAVAFAGEMLIRAGAALGALSVAQQVALADATNGALPNCITAALGAAQALVAISRSEHAHPPTDGPGARARPLRSRRLSCGS